jgi:predicted transcriptional regulator
MRVKYDHAEVTVKPQERGVILTDEFLSSIKQLSDDNLKVHNSL